jgi:predicted nucleic acid-binding protein
MKRMNVVAKRPFCDTSIAIYAASDENTKGKIARELLSSSEIVISVQVLNEFVSVGRRKLKWDWVKIRQALSDIRALCDRVLPLTAETHDMALRLAERYQYHIYDASILASAIEADCDVLYSEDMQHGHKIEGLTIQNPFA